MAMYEDDSTEDLQDMENLLAQQAATEEAKRNSIRAVERLVEKQERVEDEIGERLDEQRARQQRQEAEAWKSGSQTVGDFKKVESEWVDQAKMERMRLGRLKAQAIRDAAKQNIMAWRQEFSDKFKNGRNPSIEAASGELVMNN